jgi:hypothetical protein
MELCLLRRSASVCLMSLVIAAGCGDSGTAEPSGDEIADDETAPGGSVQPMEDGTGTPAVSDPGPTPIRLTQNTAQTIDPEVYISCGYVEFHRALSFFRVFTIQASQFGSAMDVTEVEFGILSATSATGNQPAIVRLHQLAGQMQLDNLSPLQEVSVEIPDQAQTMFRVSAAARIAAGARLAVEVHVPDGRVNDENGNPVQGNVLQFGANDAGQTAPGYFLAPSCAMEEPTDIGQTAFPDTHIVLNVLGKPVP